MYKQKGFHQNRFYTFVLFCLCACVCVHVCVCACVCVCVCACVYIKFVPYIVNQFSVSVWEQHVAGKGILGYGFFVHMFFWFFQSQDDVIDCLHLKRFYGFVGNVDNEEVCLPKFSLPCCVFISHWAKF